MSESEKLKRSLMKGILAGLAGGLAATAVKTVAEKFYASRHSEGAAETGLAKRLPVVGRMLTAGEELAASDAIHWGVGAAAGAVYGGVAEYIPVVTAKDGASFGLAMTTLSHGISGRREGQTTVDNASGMATHLVYGLVTEAVRRFVRKRLE